MTPIDLYLQGTPPGYAILLAGPWGSGKTYWWNRYSQTLGQFDRTPISMSVAGLNSYDELESELFRASIENIGTPALREAGRIFGKTLLRYAKIDPKEITLKAETFSGKTVICIDDVERFAGEFKVLFGFIVNILDRNNLHCVLLADEDHARESFNAEYGAYKERIIGRTIRIEPPLLQFAQDVVLGFADDNIRMVLRERTEHIAQQLASWKVTNLRTVRRFLSELVAILKQCGPEPESNFDQIISAVAFWAIAEAADSRNIDLVAKLFSTPGFEIAYALARPEGDSDGSAAPSELEEIATLIDRLGFANEVYTWPTSMEFGKFVLGENADFAQIAMDFGLRATPTTGRTGHELVAFLNNYRSLSDEELQEVIGRGRSYVASGDETNFSVLFGLFRSIYWLSCNGLTSFAESEWTAETLRAIEHLGAKLHSGINADIEYLHDSLDENESRVRAALDSLVPEVKKMVWAEQLEQFTTAIMTGDGELPDLVTNGPLFSGQDAATFLARLQTSGAPAVRRFGGLLRQARRIANASSYAGEDADFYDALAAGIESGVVVRRPMTILESDLRLVAKDLRSLAIHLRTG